jgi:hypothetical protein
MEQHDWTYYAFVGGCIALAFFIRYKRFGKMQRLRLGTLWIIPAIFTLLGAMILWEYPPSGLDWLWVAMGLAVGGGIGWWRAVQVEISVDPETGHLNQRSSMGALIVLGAIFLVRWLLRMAVMWGDAQWHFGAMLISDIFIAMAVGALSAYRIELYLRARRLLRGA